MAQFSSLMRDAEEAGLPASLRAMLIGALLVPLGFFLAVAWLDHRRLHDAAAADAERLSEVAREHALKIIEVDLLVLDRMADRIARLSWAEVEAESSGIGAWLRALDARFPQIAGLEYVAADGRAVLRSNTLQAAPPSLADRDWFIALAGGAPVAFSQQRRNPLTSVAFFGVARRLEAADGSFRGAVCGAILPDYFLPQWQTLSTDGAVAFALLREDGQVLAASRDGALDAMLTELPAGAAVPEGAAAVRLHRLGARGEMLAAFRPVSPFPAVIAAIIPLDAVAAAWRRDILLLGGACLLAAAGLASATLHACRRWRAEQAVQRALKAEATRREAAETSLAHARRLEALGQLTGGVAHDSNNLLTAILGTVQLLERHLGPGRDARTARLLQALRDAVDRGARLNRGLLAFARRQKLDPVSMDANALVQGFAPLLRRAVGDAHDIVLSLAPDLPACRADAGQLESALLNLAMNARDAMPAGGTIRIATRRKALTAAMLRGNGDAKPGPYVAITVQDQGMGMPEAVRDRAFEPFFTTKPVGQGTGLGLSQVFGFVRQTGGHIGLESTPGTGTLVTLFLPESGTPAAALPTREAAPATTGAAAARILLVEDDPDVRDIAAEMLRDAGFAVIAAADAASALAYLRQGEAFDLLFSDIVMPGGMDGIALAEAARSMLPGLPVLLATGYAGRGAFSAAHDFPVLNKPYDQASLIERLRALLPGDSPGNAAAA